MSTPSTDDPLAQALKKLAAEQRRNTQLTQALAQQRREHEKLQSSLHREANSRLLAEEALDETEDRLGLAIEASQLAMWEWDVYSGRVFLTERWGSIVGGSAASSHWTIEELMSRVHPQDLTRVREAVTAALSGKVERYVAEHRVQGERGWVWIESRGMVIGRDMLGRATRMVGTNADISQRKAVQAEMQQARDLAEAASRAKSEFLANISHEVRTPLNGILGLTRLMSDSPLPPEQAEYLRMVDSSAKALQALLNDVLDFSKIDAGKMVLEQIAFSLEPWLEEAVAPHALAAHAKGLQMTVRLEGRLPTKVIGDPGRLRQVISNLLSNAVKFTERGEVELAIMPCRHKGSGPGLRFEVADTGIGVPAHLQKQIFEAFSQADASVTRKYGGTGLGLAIADRLVRMMGGHLQLMSLPGKGSVFAFEAGLGVADDESTAGTPATQAPARDFDGLRVLLAEDHAVNELLMQKMLAQLGCSIVVARNGLEAVERWEGGGVDLILMDVQMPELSGLQATTQIRERERVLRRPATPIIAVTAHAMSGDREKCLAAGMNGYVSKPVSVPALITAMEEALARSSDVAPGNRGASSEPSAPAEKSALDLAKLLERLGQDREALVEIAVAMRQDLNTRIPAIIDASSRRDTEGARGHAHALKGALSSITATRAAMLAKGLETAARQGAWDLFARALPLFRDELGRVDAELAAMIPSPT